MRYIINDEKYHFKSAFDTETGAYVRTGILDENGKDVSGRYYVIEKIGKIKITARKVSIVFADEYDAYAQVDAPLDINQSVYASMADIDPSVYVIEGLAVGHKLVDFNTESTKESGYFDIVKFKVVDEDGNNVTNNYTLESNYYIYIDIV